MTTGTKLYDDAYNGVINNIVVEITDSELKLLINGSTEKNIALSSFSSNTGIITRPRVGICHEVTTSTSQTYEIYQQINEFVLFFMEGTVK